MASSGKFLYHRSVRPLDMLQGVVISILLHSIFLVGSKYWYRVLMHEPKQEISQEIPIEIVEVSPQKTDITPPSSLRATKNSLAGGKALPKKPISVVKSANLVGHKADNARSSDLTASSPVKVFQAGRQQQKTELPNLSSQQPQFKSPKTASASASEAVAPMTTPLSVPLLKTSPNPKQIPSVPATTAQIPNSKKIALAPITTPQPAQLGKTALERAATLPRSPKKKLRQSRVGLGGRTPTQAESSLKTGAASLLGGTVGVSSQNYRGDQLASVPNSNRDRIGTSGVDASSQDVDLTSYLNKLKQRVQQQWLPGMSQSNRRTVLNFTVNRSGEVNNLNIVQTSGFRVTDEVALNAIQRAAPFAPLPTGYRKNYIDIEFTFDINVFGELNLSRDGS